MEVKVYQNKSGDEPFIAWLESIKDSITQLRVRKRLRRIETGNLGDSQPVGDGVFELRLHFGSGYRVYFGRINQEVIILLIGGDKSSQVKDIQKAKLFWKDYKQDFNI
ncbi:MAG: addiction module killer protein [Parcubacteria group bacterium CG_4_9_14_0_2_um_filter_41_8]|nr:MAG: addiction module killer protein [Parcubacteria group bacterium CG22_combo_CG10-13_8_21_14_all_41_9]PIR56918.1 MAG: addiction module killer protein [Parcubacteria group bacterium CG10_big_fil_rev_8_21_14_0_10_41_35]PJC40863.1 MAG: addiction module killer protein [Parcubacteria group bacterium CG_4_9_14_0_2_um_filter_41_8]